MVQVLFIGKNSSVSQTIYDLLDQVDGLELQSMWVSEPPGGFKIELDSKDLCILNLSDWENGNMEILKSITHELPKNPKLIVIDTYKDKQLIDKILDMGVSAYIEQHKVASSIKQIIEELSTKK